jgi:hypothetical protein
MSTDWLTLRDTLKLKFRPVDQWPGKPRRDRRPSPFTASLKDTLGILRRELRELQARGVVLQIAIREKDLRQDGLPRAGAVAEHPGVILTFESKYGPMRLFHDGFSRWEHNLRAIAKHLEDLRHASLYGVGEDGQQYRGWLALPPPEGEPSTAEAAARLLAGLTARENPDLLARQILQFPGTFQSCYRDAVKRTHPDWGGSGDAFRAVQAAAEIIRRHHQGAVA